MKRKLLSAAEYSKIWRQNNPDVTRAVRDKKYNAAVAIKYKMRRDRQKGLRGDKCAECGSTCRLQFAHIKATPLMNCKSKGRVDRINEIEKYPSHFVLWCHSCHAKKGGPEDPNFHYET